MSSFNRRGLLDLPQELLREITDHLSRQDLKYLRLVCSDLRLIASPLVFITAVCALRRGVFNIFTSISNSQTLRGCVKEIVYDASYFDPETAKRYEDEETARKTTDESHAEFLNAFREQENILEAELVPALHNAVRNFPKLRRVVYADLSRYSCFRGDRVEDLGFDFRVRGDWPPIYVARTEIDLSTPRSLVSLLDSDSMLRRKYTGLTTLLRALSEPDCRAQIDDLQIGDGFYSRGAGGIPDLLLEAIPYQVAGWSAAFNRLRNLDLTLSQSPVFDHFEWIPSQFPHLELLRLVGPMCSPMQSPVQRSYAPSLRAPVIKIVKNYPETLWPKLKALELKWITFHRASFLMFLNNHRDTLRFINLQQIYIHDKAVFHVIARNLRSMYPALVIEPERRHLPPQNSSVQTILNFTLHHEEATLTNMSDDMHADDYDEEEISDYSADEHHGDDERYSSEELDYSDDGEGLMDDENEVEKELSMIVQYLQKSDHQKLDVTAFHKACAAAEKTWSLGNPQDAADLAEFLVSTSETLTKVFSITGTIDGCEKCSLDEPNCRTMLRIEVPKSKSASVNDGIHTSGECKHGVTGNFRMQSAPDNILLELHRSFLDEAKKTIKKNENLVRFPENLDLEVEYEDMHACELLSVISHYGTDQDGHYIAFLKTGKDNWYEANDSTIRPVQFDITVMSANAAILFYYRATTTPVVNDAKAADHFDVALSKEEFEDLGEFKNEIPQLWSTEYHKHSDHILHLVSLFQGPKTPAELYEKLENAPAASEDNHSEVKEENEDCHSFDHASKDEAMESQAIQLAADTARSVVVDVPSSTYSTSHDHHEGDITNHVDDTLSKVIVNLPAHSGQYQSQYDVGVIFEVPSFDHVLDGHNNDLFNETPHKIVVNIPTHSPHHQSEHGVGTSSSQVFYTAPSNAM
ncbi:MAG: hypothetical protein Q9218_006563 [Villophora microphyllina]